MRLQYQRHGPSGRIFGGLPIGSALRAPVPRVTRRTPELLARILRFRHASAAECGCCGSEPYEPNFREFSGGFPRGDYKYPFIFAAPNWG